MNYDLITWTRAVGICEGDDVLLYSHERMLLEEFGEEYEEYRKRTKRLIPYVY